MFRRLERAANCLDAERYEDVLIQLRPLASAALRLAEVHELRGLALYGVARFEAAVEELEAYRQLSGSTERHPVLADCHRALEHWADVEALWRELGETSPGPEIMTEGRIVLSGAHADRGDLDEALRILEKGWRMPSRPRFHQLRWGYALADIYERSGRLPRARNLFGWVEHHEPELADVRARVHALR